MQVLTVAALQILEAHGKPMPKYMNTLARYAPNRYGLETDHDYSGKALSPAQ